MKSLATSTEGKTTRTRGRDPTAGLRATKALLKVGGACNEKCVFCHATPTRDHDSSTAQILRKIDLAADRGFEMVVLSGGEPTIREDLGALVERIGERGMALGLVTNGRRFAYPQFTRGLLARGLRYVYLSLHGGDRETQDRAVRAASFDEAVAGLRNLVGQGAWITVHCVVTKLNVEKLDALVDLVVPLGVRLKFSFVQPKGDGLLRVEALTPKLTDAATAIRAAFARARRIRADADLAFDGLPMCLLPGEESRWDDLRTNAILVMSESVEEGWSDVDARDWVKTERCADCRHRGICPGVHREYHARWGDSELRPAVGARANSHDYVTGAAVVGRPGPSCPALDRVEPAVGRARSLWLADGDRMRLATTDTRDFDDAQIAEIRARAQVYVDRAPGAAPTDFARDLVLLRPAGACAPCVARSRCPGAWEPAGGTPFEDADAPVRAWIRGLRGKVLDVGCGAPRYVDDVRRPDLDWLGVDPDPGADAGGLPIVRMAIEDLPLEGRAFDHVLWLRSWNHLADPRAVAARLAAAVRVGGTFAVADDVPFALVRDPARIRRRDGATDLRLEHLHLDDSHRALDRLAGLPLRVVAHHPVVQGRATQWSLFMEKTAR
jgi:MoaA/NifB/PqqE/SkfB family radical SAM enzyme/SAM-dependent methyltransferase